jgi:glycosyltransferase involved in cell wall biosynthesis
MGFAVPELIYPDSKVFSLHPWATRIKKRIELKIKKFYVKQDADFYWTETEDCKERMYKYLVNRKKPIQVIGNTYSHYYRQSQDSKKKILPEKPANSIRFITISANYVHKNLSIIREVSLELEKLKIDHEFVVTIPKEEFDVLFDGAKNVKTVGRVLPSKCPQLYKESDFVFLPTLLECFTANYPEGMIMGKPILTTNYSFAKDLCREAAVYFDPMDKKDIVACIRNLLKDPLKQEKLIEAGLERVKDFPTALERAQNVINLCEKYGNQS